MDQKQVLLSQKMKRLRFLKALFWFPPFSGFVIGPMVRIAGEIEALQRSIEDDRYSAKMQEWEAGGKVGQMPRPKTRQEKSIR